MAPAPIPLLIQLEGLALRGRAWLNQRGRGTFVALSVAAALGLSLFCLSPRLCILLHEPYPGTFEWDRALNFLAQVRDPFHASVEPALRWRIAPALLAHLLHLPGYAAFIVPWAGLVLALAYAAKLAEARLRDRLDALLLVTLLGTLAAVQSVTMAHGINDGWLLAAMLATAFSANPSVRLAAALFGPWVDERYLLALPVNLVCRCLFGAEQTRPIVPRFAVWEIVGILPYLAIRSVTSLHGGDAVSGGFIQQALAIVPVYLPHAPLGWWMGERAAWVLVAFAFLVAHRLYGRSAVQWLALCTLTGFGAITLLAADLTRSTNFFLTLTCAGAFVAHEIVGPHRTRWLAALLALNVLLPFAMLTYIWIEPIHSLPFELIRLYKNW